jgi:hypothetical protein
MVWVSALLPACGNVESAREQRGQAMFAAARRTAACGQSGAQKMITERAISPDPIAANASLTSSSLRKPA